MVSDGDLGSRKFEITNPKELPVHKVGSMVKRWLNMVPIWSVV